ncbi:MAG: hypothetical protein ACFFCP_19270, partial [Promethearchaeota archaeon]
YNISLLATGIHNITITASDLYGNVATDSVMVNIIANSSPFIEGPNLIEFNYGEIGIVISWNCSDRSPNRYILIMNGTIFQESTWEGSDIHYIADNLRPGMYNLTLQIFDVQGLSSSHSVEVLVHAIQITSTPTTPEIPSDLEGWVQAISIAISIVALISIVSLVFSLTLMRKVSKET